MTYVDFDWVFALKWLIILWGIGLCVGKWSKTDFDKFTWLPRNFFRLLRGFLIFIVGWIVGAVLHGTIFRDSSVDSIVALGVILTVCNAVKNPWLVESVGVWQIMQGGKK